MNKKFFKTRVISRNFIVDLKADVLNLIGKNLTPYEKMIISAKDQMWVELNKEGITPKWFRYEISYMSKGALVIVLYGESE